MADLYCVTDTRNNRKVMADGFDSKADAKMERDLLNKDADGDFRYTVSRGSDHPNGPSRK